MKKQLLLFILPMLFFTATLQAQDIKYWDFGAKELGTGYTNLLPTAYLNAFSDYTVQSEWLDSSDPLNPITKFPNAGKVNESGYSYEYIYNNLFLFSPEPTGYSASPGSTTNFTLSSKGSSPTPPSGTLLGGGSAYTHPNFMPDIDGTIDMVFMKDSNSDKLYTVNSNLTRYDERTGMPDAGADATLFPGCLQFVTPGEKKPNRGFLLNLEAGQQVTVVGSGQVADINKDGLVFKVGAFTFEQQNAPGVPVMVEDYGSGVIEGVAGNTDGACDESFRVMHFTAGTAGQYKLGYKYGTVRYYRIYLGNVNALGVDSKLSPVTTDVHAVGNRIYISNVKSSTEVKIYAITGALVKEFKTTSNTNFEFRAGLYIATVKTSEGQKSVKLLLK